jgi:hypothetical protein
MPTVSSAPRTSWPISVGTPRDLARTERLRARDLPLLRPQPLPVPVTDMNDEKKNTKPDASADMSEESPAVVEAGRLATEAGLLVRMTIIHRATPVCGRCTRAPCSCEGGASWPCSLTCTHDDARNPGHPERVRERSEAVRDVVDGGPGARGPVRAVSREARREMDAYEAGCDDARAACWGATRDILQKYGISDASPMREEVKAAIEGATP